jgi:two-component system sensor histidine kinase HydH
VAHELRNPLSSIKGLAVLLKAKVAGDPEGNNTADLLVQEVERLNRSISELLDYARPEKLQLQPVSLKTILEKAATLVGIDAESLGITISRSFISSGDLVLVDADKMNQVFLNLLLNAIQAMVDGGELSIRTELEKHMVVCTMEDNGEGIAEENISRFFDPYFTTKSDGTGLGLALSAKIVEEHGGSVALESRSGHGTRVMVRLPSAA